MLLQVSWQSGYCGKLLIYFFNGSIPFDALNRNLKFQTKIFENTFQIKL